MLTPRKQHIKAVMKVTTRQKILDDVARMAGGSMSILSGLQKQVKEDIRLRFEDMATKLDLVPREDFERLEALLQETAIKQATLEERLNKLEKTKKKK